MAASLARDITLLPFHGEEDIFVQEGDNVGVILDAITATNAAAARTSLKVQSLYTQDGLLLQVGILSLCAAEYEASLNKSKD